MLSHHLSALLATPSCPSLAKWLSILGTSIMRMHYPQTGQRKPKGSLKQTWKIQIPLWAHNSFGIQGHKRLIRLCGKERVTTPNVWMVGYRLQTQLHSLCTTNLLPSTSLLCSPKRPMNLRDQVLRQGRDFNWGAGSLRKWQGSKNYHLIGVWMPASFID